MPIELQIIRAHEFIRLGAQGHFDLAASKAVLSELAKACRKRGIDHALLDLRALHPGPKPAFTPDDLAVLVKSFREMGFTREQRLAVLYDADPHFRVRLFAFIGTLRGWTVQAFNHFEDAISWLSSGSAADTNVPHPALDQKIPVRQVRSIGSKPKPGLRSRN